jgi:hypothetical protein
MGIFPAIKEILCADKPDVTGSLSTKQEKT